MLTLANRIGRHPALHPCFWAACAAVLLMVSTSARAIPAYARQTGSSCADCHAAAYGPALTPFGMRFKLNGYTDTDGNGGKIPLAAQLIETYTNPARGNSSTALTEADVYLAGRLTDHIGGYVKTETDRTAPGKYRTRLGNLDLRFVAKNLALGGKNLTIGVSVNNSPGFQDPIAALPAASTLGPPGVTGTLLNLSSPNAPSNRVIGTTVYGLYDSNWYGEVGTYRSLSASQQDNLGYAVSGDPGKLTDTGYFRFAYMKDLKSQFFSAGLVALTTRRQLPRTSAPDNLTDLGYDLTYQFLGNRQNIVQASYVNIFERRRYGSTSAAVSGLARGSARDQTLSLAYTFRQSYTILVSYLKSTGSRDMVRYVPYGEPSTTSNLISVYWTPFGKDDSFTWKSNLKLSATWFRFTRFNGSKTNIFGVPPGFPGTDAHDLNAFSLAVSVAF